MKTFRHYMAAALIALLSYGCGTEEPLASQRGGTQGTVVQDGIEVEPLSRSRAMARDLVPPEVVEQQSAQQYAAMVDKAKQQGALFPASHPQVQRLRNIAQRIIPHSKRWNPDAASWKWEVNLFNSKEINAFCLPGGRIGFYSGIIDTLKLTDDEIAAIMGHEVAHALREHGRERAGKAGATELAARLGGAVAASVFGIDPQLAGGVANTAGQLLVLKFSRNEEREADLVGLDIAARAGYDPRAGIALWEKMAAVSQGAPIQLLSTHPGGPERIDRIRQNLHLLMPLYARSKGTTPDKLPGYRSNPLR